MKKMEMMEKLVGKEKEEKRKMNWMLNQVRVRVGVEEDIREMEKMMKEEEGVIVGKKGEKSRAYKGTKGAEPLGKGSDQSNEPWNKARDWILERKKETRLRRSNWNKGEEEWYKNRMEREQVDWKAGEENTAMEELEERVDNRMYWEKKMEEKEMHGKGESWNKGQYGKGKAMEGPGHKGGTRKQSREDAQRAEWEWMKNEWKQEVRENVMFWDARETSQSSRPMGMNNDDVNMLGMVMGGKGKAMEAKGMNNTKGNSVMDGRTGQGPMGHGKDGLGTCKEGNCKGTKGGNCKGDIWMGKGGREMGGKNMGNAMDGKGYGGSMMSGRVYQGNTGYGGNSWNRDKGWMSEDERSWTDTKWMDEGRNC